MAFDLEKNMTPIIQKNIKTFLNDAAICKRDDELLFALELPVHYRMIDVAVALVKKEDVTDEERVRSIKVLKNLNPRALDILSMIYAYDKTSIFSLKNQLGMSTQEIKIHLLKLIKIGLIKKESRFMYSVCDWIDILPKSIVSIELKLSKWQEALEQGIYNLKFSDYSFVALDEEQLPHKKNIERYFMEKNVGLLYLNSNGEIKIAHLPKTNKEIDVYMRSFQKIKIAKDLINKNNKWNLIKEME